MTLAVSEADGYPQEFGGRNDFRAVRKIGCLWSQRLQIADSAMEGQDGFGELYPYKPESLARAKTFAIEARGKQSQDPGFSDRSEYQQAWVIINYETPRSGEERSAGGGRQDGIIERFEDSAEMLRLPAERFVWEDGSDLRQDEAPSRLDVGSMYVLTRTRLPNLAVIPDPSGLVGRINNASFTLFTFARTYSPEQLLFLEPLFEHSVNPRSGMQTFSVSYRLAIRSHSWNEYWRPSRSRYEKIFYRPPIAAGQAMSYPTGDFGRL